MTEDQKIRDCLLGPPEEGRTDKGNGKLLSQVGDKN
jgi:hypothetical protein